MATLELRPGALFYYDAPFRQDFRKWVDAGAYPGSVWDDDSDETYFDVASWVEPGNQQFSRAASADFPRLPTGVTGLTMSWRLVGLGATVTHQPILTISDADTGEELDGLSMPAGPASPEWDTDVLTSPDYYSGRRIRVTAWDGAASSDDPEPKFRVFEVRLLVDFEAGCSVDLRLGDVTTTGTATAVGIAPLGDQNDATYVDLVKSGSSTGSARAVVPALSQAVADRVISVTLNVLSSVTSLDGARTQAILRGRNNVYRTGFHPGGGYLQLPPGDLQLTTFTPDADHLAGDAETIEALANSLTGGDGGLGAMIFEPYISGDESYRIHEAWLTFNYVCFGRLRRRPLRQFPRDDGLGMSSARRVDANRSMQASLRRGGGVYF